MEVFPTLFPVMRIALLSFCGSTVAIWGFSDCNPSPIWNFSKSDNIYTVLFSPAKMCMELLLNSMDSQFSLSSFEQLIVNIQNIKNNSFIYLSPFLSIKM